MPKQDKSYIAFDFGTKFIGVATGQTITRTATALTSLKAINGHPNWQEIEKLVKTWRPDALVVGIPYNMDGSVSDMVERARSFAQTCHNKTGLPVYECDERLSTQEAKAAIFEMEGARALTKEAIDSYSAKLILESWMENHNNDQP